jgi:putative redox protein
VLKAKSTTGYKIELSAGNHTWLSDEPEGVGEDAGPNPYELLLSSLAACTLMTVQMYARRKNWPLESAAMELSQEHIHADDCANCETTGRARVNIITGSVTLTGPLDKEQRTRLLQIANRCPVHRTLKMETRINLSEG